jgi:hypothetical protein
MCSCQSGLGTELTGLARLSLVPLGRGQFAALGRVPRLPTPGKHGAPKIDNLRSFRELCCENRPPGPMRFRFTAEIQALVFNICSAFLREASVSLAPLNIRAISSFL